MIKIGSHVSFSNKGLWTATEEAIRYGSSSFMIYTGAPQNTRRKPLDSLYVEEGRQLMEQHNIEEIVVHAPYIINLGSYKPSTFKLAVDFLQSEIHRTAYLGVKNIVLHPGAYTDKDVEFGINRIAEGLNEVLNNTQHTNVHIALETMAGKGTEIGRNFDELASIIDKVTANERLNICFDTCHVHDAGYNIVHDLDSVLKQFDDTIGLQRLAVIHLNDSKNQCGAGKDRHATVGAGMIGFATLQHLVYHEQLADRLFILETPWIGKDTKKQRPMYEIEIALLRGDVASRFGLDFLLEVERLEYFFKTQNLIPRQFVLETWELLQKSAAGRKADPREPLERLLDKIVASNLFPGMSEEGINQRLTACLAKSNQRTIDAKNYCNNV